MQRFAQESHQSTQTKNPHEIQKAEANQQIFADYPFFRNKIPYSIHRIAHPLQIPLGIKKNRPNSSWRHKYQQNPHFQIDAASKLEKSHQELTPNQETDKPNQQ